jgi:hypothetical protein
MQNEENLTTNEVNDNVEEVQESNALQTVLFDNTTFSDFLKSGAVTIESVEKELMEIYKIIKGKIVSSKPEEALLHINTAREFLELATKQSESRAKLIQSAVSALKSNQTNNSTFNQQLNIQNRPKIKFSDDDDPLKSNEIEKKIVTNDDAKSGIEDAEYFSDIPVIHSPGYQEKKT